MRKIAALTMCALATLPVSAQEISPVGTWEIESRDSRYEVTLCGDGTQLCAELVWLGNGADTEDNLPYLNTLLIDHAPQVGPNQWKGELHLYGQTASGTITQLDNGRISLEGCFLLVVCRTYEMYRME